MTAEPDQPARRVRAYYRALDDGEYGLLAELLAPDVVQERPDMTLSGRDRFVAFMREERPVTGTRHPIDAVFARAEGDAIAVQGRLVDPDGDVITRFVDVFSFEAGDISRIQTYVRE